MTQMEFGLEIFWPMTLGLKFCFSELDIQLGRLLTFLILFHSMMKILIFSIGDNQLRNSCNNVSEKN